MDPVTEPGLPRLAVRSVAALWGLQFSFLNPALALLLVSVFGASTGEVSVVLAVYNAACLLTSWAVPRWADQRADYVRPMIGCAVLTVALCVVLGVANHLPLAVVGLVFLGAPAAVGTPLLFGFIRHSGAPASEVVRTRAVFSAAWVAGPPTAAAIVSAFGGHTLVWGIGLVGAVNIVATSRLRHAPRPVPARSPAADATARTPTASHGMIALLLVIFALLQASNSAAVAITTLFVTDDLNLSPVWGGVALGMAAGLEVPVLLLLSRSGHRLRDLTLLTVACLLGTTYYVLMATAPNGVVVVAAQLMNAAFYAVLVGVGLTLFQAVIPGPGRAAGLLSNAQRAGALLAGPLIGIGSIFASGLRSVFLACAVLAVVSFALLRLVARRTPQAGF